MMSQPPTGRGRGKKKPPVSKPEPLNQISAEEEQKKEKVEEVQKETNKYAPKEKIGTPTLGRSPNYVETVGLGKLKVITNGTSVRRY